MLVEVEYVRDARSVTEVSPPTIIGQYALLVGVIVRNTRSSLQLSLTQPSGGGIDDLVLYEVPTGAINGSNQVFSTVDAFDTIVVFYNGQRLTIGTDFTVTGGNEITMTSAPQVGDIVTVEYIKA